MCGISGIVSLNRRSVDKSMLEKMSEALLHRGPDAYGFWYNSDNTVGFGHRRLSIIDLTDKGLQPFIYLNKYVIIFNGEIYNYREIKQDLTLKGVSFMTETDTEVLGALYHQYKNKMFSAIDGMFSFVIYNQETKEIFGARDRFGEKPLYYTIHNNQFYFASEIKAFWHAGIPRKINPSRLYYFLTKKICEYPQYNDTTFFENIFQVLPGNCFTLTPGGPSFERYWNIDAIQVNSKIDFKDAVLMLKDLFDESIKNRLRADVPIGSSLSGGLDSSIIVKIIEYYKTNSNVQKTFSARFKNFTKDEGEFIETLLKSSNTIDSYFTWPNENLFSDTLDKISYYQDEPFASASIVAQWHVMKLVKENNITVLLDGQGADEIFAGYLSFINPYMNELYKSNLKEYHKQKKYLRDILNIKFKLGINAQLLLRFPWSFKALKPLRKILPKNETKEIRNHFGFNKLFLKNVRFTDYQNPSQNNDCLLRAQLNTIKYDGLPSLLRYADRNSMAHSLEVRMPYLSHKLAEFALSLPISYKINMGYPKFILRESFADKVPEQIVWRKDKIGYEAPQSEWLNGATDKIKKSKEKLLDLNIIEKDSFFDDWNLLIAGYYV